MTAERTDRELLELAAKAAGIEHGADRIDSGLSLTDGGHFPKWNPLEDDGDALRLAVELQIEISFGASDVTADGHIREPSAGDQRAPARRAIVRAAAAMAEGGEQ